jgi:hypothetical protein
MKYLNMRLPVFVLQWNYCRGIETVNIKHLEGKSGTMSGMHQFRYFAPSSQALRESNHRHGIRIADCASPREMSYV